MDAHDLRSGAGRGITSEVALGGRLALREWVVLVSWLALAVGVAAAVPDPARVTGEPEMA